MFSVQFGELDTVEKYHLKAYERAKTSLSGFNNKYLTSELSPFYSVILRSFIIVKKALFENDENTLADKVYYLNKMLNSVDLFYAIELPERWSCKHPLGSVMGGAKYGDFFSGLYSRGKPKQWDIRIPHYRRKCYNVF